MTERFFFGLSIFLALMLHAAIFIYLPENTSKLSPGSREKGIGGLKIGFIGSTAGNGLPVSTLIATNATNEHQESTQNPIKPINEISPPEVLATAPDSPPIIHPSSAKLTPLVKAKPLVQTKKKKAIAKPIKKRVKTPKNPESTLDSNLNKALAGTMQIPVNEQQSTGQGTNKHASALLGKGNSSEGGGKKGSIQNYKDVILAWLEKHKRYPRMARRRNQQGTALLYFKIDRNGTVLKHNIRNSSGYKALDKEVAAMLHRASPLPSAPYNITGKTMEFTLPVAFNINH